MNKSSKLFCMRKQTSSKSSFYIMGGSKDKDKEIKKKKLFKLFHLRFDQIKKKKTF